MMQPDLGNKISQARKAKNMTQEELVEACNVSVRTIQRIESGEVTPRASTIRIILEALDMDYDRLDSNESSPSQQQSFFDKLLLLRHDKNNLFASYYSAMQMAWIAGIIYFAMGVVEASMDYAHFKDELDDEGKLLYATAKGFILFAYFLYFRGFVILGEVFDNSLLKLAAIASIVLNSLVMVMDIYFTYFLYSEEFTVVIYATESILLGSVGILVGVGLIRLQDGMGDVARFAGMLEILAGGMFVSVVFFFLGYIVMVPMTILEIILLFKGYEYIEKSRGTD